MNILLYILYVLVGLLVINALMMVIAYSPFSTGTGWVSKLWNKIKSEIGY